MPAMRFVIYGAGAVGGTIGARLAQHGHDVALIARGAHLEAIRSAGLRVDDPDGTATLELPAAGSPAELGIGPEDVVLLAMKTQDTAAALHSLAAAAPPSTPVVCAQNGVENERIALRYFERVYGINVMCPTVLLEPGVVQINSSPIAGILDIGRYPSGVDDVAKAVAEAIDSSAMLSTARDDIMRWKYRKLFLNLGNAIEAVCGALAGADPLTALVSAEADAVFDAAGIDRASAAEDDERRADHLRVRPAGGRPRPGGSSWQSLQRGTGTIESDFLNGEVVMLGRLHGVPTPANLVLQRLANDLAARRSPPGAYTAAEVLRLVDEAGQR
jgi:2-dehydropantoate 2-reductase